MNKSQSNLRFSLLILAILFSISAAYYAYAASFSPPIIQNASVEPTKVRPGDVMQVWANVSDAYGISSVSAQVPHEKGFDIVDMLLSSGTVYSGIWRGQWNVHDTLVKNYTTKITARNVLGQESYALAEWSDPACTFSCDTVSGSVCIVNTAHSVNIGCYVDDSLLGGATSIEIQSGGSVYNNTNNASFMINVTGNITIKNGGNISGNVNISAVNLTIDSGGKIDISGKGYAIGDGSGAGSTGAAGSYYGSLTDPNDMGSGGGNGAGYSGAGGGLLRLNVTGTLNVSGSITANGGTGASSSPGCGWSGGGYGGYGGARTTCGPGGGGGGSGGGIYINASTFAGTGSITANGGSTGGDGGAGGGGRIAVYYTTKTFSGSTTAYGGTATNGGKGGAGTIYIQQSGQNGQLILDNNNNAGAQTPLNESITIGDMTIRKSANVDIVSDKTLTLLNGNLLNISTPFNVSGKLVLNNVANAILASTTVVLGSFNATNTNITLSGTLTANNLTTFPTSNMTITGTLNHLANSNSKLYYLNMSLENLVIASGGKIDASGKGYAGGTYSSGHYDGYGPGAGKGNGGVNGGDAGGLIILNVSGILNNSGTITANGNNGNNGGCCSGLGGGGGAYGGNGGAGGSSFSSLVGGTVYDDIKTPNNLGSGGGSSDYNFGGGGGGGGGGSIYVTAGTFIGTGTITANGGSGGNDGGGPGKGGGGGGGRIALYYSTKTFSGTITAYGGAYGGSGGYGSQYGGAGTIFQKSASQTYGDLVIDNNGTSGANTPLNSSAYSTAFDIVAIQNAANVSSAVSPLSLNATTITGNGTLYLGTNSTAIRASNLSMSAGSITSTSGQINITLPNSINSSNFIGTISTSSGKINIWYGSATTDRCDISGATVSGTASYYYARWSNVTAYRCVRAIILDNPAIMDSANATRTKFNINESFYPYIRIREYNGTDYFNVSGSWTMDIYNSNNSGVPNVTGVSLTNASWNYSWRTVQRFNGSALNAHSFLANVSGNSGVGMTNFSLANSYNYWIKQLNITYALNDSVIYTTESALINGTVWREPEHAVSGSTPVNITVNTGSTNAGGKITDVIGNYNFTYLPPAVSSITSVNFTINATDSDGIKNYTASPVGAIKVYPAINFTASRAWTDRQYYNKGENITFAAYLNQTAGGELRNGVVRAYDSNFSSPGYTGLNEKNGFWNGTYEGNYTIQAGDNSGNWTIDSRTEANWGIALSNATAYINPFKIISGTYADTSFMTARENFTQSALSPETMHIKVQNDAGNPSPINATVVIRDSAGTVASTQDVLNLAVGIAQDVQYTITDSNIGLTKSLVPGYWTVSINATNSTGGKAYRVIPFFVMPDFWVEDSSASNYWEYRLRLTLDNSRGIARNNVSVKVNGSELSAMGVNLATLNIGSIRIVNPDINGIGANEAEGRSIPYYTNASGTFGQSDYITFAANISDNSKKAYYVYYSTSSISAPSYGSFGAPFFPVSFEQSAESSPLKIYGLVTDKSTYKFGETVHVSASIFSNHPSSSKAHFYFRNSTGADIGDITHWNVNDTNTGSGLLDKIYEGESQGALQQSYGDFGTWTVYVEAYDMTIGPSPQDTRAVSFTVDQLNVPVLVSQTTFDAGTQITVFGNITRASNGVAADGANFTIKRDGIAVYTNLTGIDGNFSYTYTESTPGIHTLAVYSNKTYSGIVVPGDNSTQITVHPKVDMYIQSQDTNRDPADSPTFLINVTKNYADIAQTIYLDFQLNDTYGATGYTIARKTIIVPALGSNNTTADWDIRGVAPQNYTIIVMANESANIYVAGQNSTLFNRLNITESIAPQNVNTFQNLNVSGFVGDGSTNTARDTETVNITILGPENYTYTVTASAGNYNKTFSVGTHGNYTVSVVSAGTQYKGYNAANFTVNYTANLTIALDASTIKANKVLGINVTTKSNDNSSVSGVSTNITLLYSDGSSLQSLLNITQGYAALQNKTNTTSWATSTWAPGTYYIRARAYLEGKQAGEANRSFEINETRNVTESISTDASNYNMFNYAAIFAWVNRTGNVLINGTADMYLLAYDGTRYEAELNDSGAWTTVNITYTGILSQPVQARWNTQNFHNGTYYPYIEFNYTDEYGNPVSIKANSTMTINAVWNATFQYKYPVILKYNWTDQFANVTVTINNTGNTELCDVAGECELYVEVRAVDDGRYKVLTQSTGHAPGWQIIGNVPPVDISGTKDATADGKKDFVFRIDEPGFWLSGNYTINATVLYDGGASISNSTITFEILETVGNITLVAGAGSPYTHNKNFSSNTDVTFNSEWYSEGANINKPLTGWINLSFDPYPDTIQQLSKNFTVSPSVNSNDILWNTGQMAPGKYFFRYWISERTNTAPLNFLYGAETIFRTNYDNNAKYFFISPTKDSRITSIAVNKGSNYTMNEDVVISGTAWRRGNVDFPGNLDINVTGPAGTFALSSCDRQIDINSTVNATFGCTWNTANYSSGIYNVSAAVKWGTNNITLNWTSFGISPKKTAQVSLASDKGSYAMNENISAEVNITDAGNANITGNLTLLLGGIDTKQIYAENDIEISTAVKAVRDVLWNITNTHAGTSYILNATYKYYNEGGSLTVVSATKAVEILPNTNATARISADKPQYGDHEDVTFNFNITTAGNKDYSSLNYVISINNSVGQVRSSSWISVARNGTNQSSYAWNTASWPNGSYLATITITGPTSESWSASTVFSIRRVEIAGIVGLNVSRIPPQYYNSNEDIVIQDGRIVGLGNANFTGNLTVKFVKKGTSNVFATYTCNDVPTTSYLLSSCTGASVSTSTWSNKIGRVILNASFAYNNGTQQLAVASTEFQIGTTQVNVTTTSLNNIPRNTFFKKDAIRVHVHIRNTTGNDVSGIGAGNVTSATLNGQGIAVSGWTDMGGGEYYFTLPELALGTYTVSVVLQDPFELTTGTDSESFEISEHWVTFTISSSDISPLSNAAKRYASSELPGSTATVLISRGALKNITTASNSITISELLENNKIYLVFTQATQKKIDERMAMLESGEFEKYSSPSFGFPLNKDYHVSVGMEYTLRDINVLGDMQLYPGMYTFIIRNEGVQNGKTAVSISRK